MTSRSQRPEDDLRALAGDLRTSVTAEATARAVGRAISARPRRPRRLALVAVAAGITLIGNVAFAGTIDEAVPGDLLYPLDRAREWIADRWGGEDHTSERLDEAEVLIERQDFEAAMELALEIGEANLANAAAKANAAALAGDEQALATAIDDVKEAANEVAEEASGGKAGGDASDPATNPGNKPADSPSVTRPDNSEKDKDKDAGPTSPPGNSGSAGSGGQGPGSGQGPGQGQGSGGGQGKGQGNQP